MPDGNPRVVLPWEYAVKSVAFSPDGKRLGAGTAGGEVLLLDPATGELLKTLRGHTYNVEAVAFSADGKTLASGSDDGTIILWDMEY